MESFNAKHRLSIGYFIGARGSSQEASETLDIFYPGTPRRLLGVIDKYFVITKSNVFLSFSVFE